MTFARPVAKLADLPPNGMHGIEVDGAKILLIRRGDAVMAIEGTCPHAGAPLAEGVLDGAQVICPWHKAAFSVHSGKCLQPPAVDDLRHFPVELRDGEVFVDTSGVAPPPRLPAGRDDRRFVVIGGGAAGEAAVQTLREEGFSGRLVMVDDTGALPYDRTILSKFVLSGAEAGEKSPLQDETFYKTLAIERRRATVARLDAVASRITFADGETLVYDAALIATGAIPQPPPFPGGKMSGVFVLRDSADAARIAAAAEKARQAVVIGASFIGMEAAASLRERGLDVTVVAPQARPFEAQLGARVGAVFQALHERKGVAFRMNSKVARLDGDGAVAAVVLESGERLAADLVIAGLGVRPATGFITDPAPRDDGGIIVDSNLRFAGTLFAAGDVAAFPLRGDGARIRVEHWRVAQQHGRVAARNMLGHADIYDAVPYFWTSHFMQRLDYVGHASGDDDLVVRGQLAGNEPSFIAYYLRDGYVAAAAGLGRDQEMAAILALMTRRRAWRADDLHPDGGSPLTVLAASN